MLKMREVEARIKPQVLLPAQAKPAPRSGAGTPPQGSEGGPGQKVDARSTTLRLSCVHSQVQHRRATQALHALQACPSNTVDTSQGPDPSPRLPGLGAHLNTHLSQFRQPQGSSSPIMSPDRAGEQDRLDQGMGSKLTFPKPPLKQHTPIFKSDTAF